MPRSDRSHPRIRLGARCAIAGFALALCLHVSGCASTGGNANQAGSEPVTRLGGLHPTDLDMSKFKPAPDDKTIGMELNFAMQHKDQFDELMRETQDPRSRQYQHWLTPEEMQARFGVSQGQFNAVRDWLTSQGFVITDQSYGGNEDYIKFKGTIAQAEKAFKVDIVTPEYEHFANKEDPAIPPQFAGVISTITGLSGEVY